MQIMILLLFYSSKISPYLAEITKVEIFPIWKKEKFISPHNYSICISNVLHFLIKVKIKFNQ